jgi:hypothetical protein
MAKKETSVAESLRRAHRALRKDLQKLEDSVQPTSDQGIPIIRAILDATRTHVLEHFRFEEQDGYMDKVRKREPRLQHAIDQLAGEHRRLAEALDALIENAKQASTLDPDLRRKTREWIATIRQHEAREDELVQDSFNLDVSAED